MKIEHIGDAYRFATYSSRMIDDPVGIAEELRASAREQGIKFDTIVGRGSSGMLIVPLVARILRKKWFIVRKDEEVNSSHDSSCKWMGELGKRWIFLDDFCSSGATFRAVRNGVREAVEVATAPYQTWSHPQNDPTGPLGWYTYKRPPLETELVGYFQYESREADCKTLVPWDENATPGYNDMYWDDTPRGLADKAARDAERAEKERIKGEKIRAKAERLYEQAIDGSVYTTNDLGQPVTAYGTCGDNCIVCSGAMEEARRASDDREVNEVEIKAWGSTRPITNRYTMQLASGAIINNPQDNVIVRNI